MDSPIQIILTKIKENELIVVIPFNTMAETATNVKHLGRVTITLCIADRQLPSFLNLVQSVQGDFSVTWDHEANRWSVTLQLIQ